MAFYRLERLINLYDGYRQVFMVQGRSLLLLQEGGRPLLISNRCPHQDFPLQNASVAGGVLRCAQHGLDFSLQSGRCLQQPQYQLQQYVLSYEGAYIGIDLP